MQARFSDIGREILPDQMSTELVSAPGIMMIQEAPVYHDIRVKLRERIPKEHVSKRTGPGGLAVSYVTGEYAIRKANEIFGEDGWQTEIKSVNVDHTREGTSFETIARVHIRVTALNVFKEDIGFDTKKSGSKYANEENAIKAAVTDGIKRCLRQFGDALGNSIYDKKYIQELNALSIPK